VNLVLPEAAHCHEPYLATRANDYTDSVRTRILLGRTIPAVDYLDARDMCRTLRSEVDAALGDADALVLPTLPIVAPPLGADTVTIGSSADQVPVRSAMLRHTQLFNLTGHPAISLPIASPGLPVGLQLVGRHGATGRLLEVAAACEKTLDVRI
jgi:aspartyl-tRNA(Asn)/glutamyl-tRNA(Gln) amidotransferase subunit A